MVEQNHEVGSADDTDMGCIVILLCAILLSKLTASPALRYVSVLPWFGGWQTQENGDQLARESGSRESFLYWW